MRGIPVGLALLLAIPGWTQPASVLTANYNANRTNANVREFTLNTANVNVNQFGKLFTRAVDGQIYAQPLYVHGQPGKPNVVYVATMHNSVYAFDADDPSASAPLWQVNLGPSVPSANYVCSDLVPPEVGILSTPVINPATGTLYAVANSLEQGTYFYRLHALDLASGQEKPGSPVVIQAAVPGTGWGSQQGVVRFAPGQHLQRPGLLFTKNTIYVAFGSHCDNGLWHGWLIGYSASTLQQVSAFNTTPNGRAGAIWQGGRAPAADALGNIYVTTGNGDWDGSANRGQSLLKLDPAGSSVLDWFTPDNYPDLNRGDLDVGTSGPMLVPGTSLLLAGSKDGLIRVVDTNAMGHLQPGNSQIVQQFPAAANPGYIFSTAFWNNTNGPLLYVWGWGDHLKSYRLSGGSFDSTPTAQGAKVAGFQGGILAVSAAGSTPGTGILWAVTRETNQEVYGPTTLRAFDASNVARQLWNSNLNASRDQLGTASKMCTPTVVNGKVYVGTFDNQLVVYGLLPPPSSASLSARSAPRF